MANVPGSPAQPAEVPQTGYAGLDDGDDGLRGDAASASAIAPPLHTEGIVGSKGFGALAIRTNQAP